MITKVEEFRDKHTVSGNNKGDILITGFANVENKKCFCIMADGHRYYGIYQEIPVSDELYEEWRALQNETQRVHRKEVYHRDWTPIEDLFEMPKSYEQNPMEDTLLWDEQVAALYAAIAQLTPIQQRRIHMLMENMTIREIARQEGCHMNAALKSVNGALKKLHDLLKDWA